MTSDATSPAPPATDPLRGIDVDGTIRPGQRKALFALAATLGLDIDELRDLTPARSISKLTVAQAAELLDRLRGGGPNCSRQPAKRRPAGVIVMVTDAQLARIDALRRELRWTRAGLGQFLSQRTHEHGGPMNVIRTTKDGRAVMMLLSQVAARMKRRPGGDRVLDSEACPSGAVADAPAMASSLVWPADERFPGVRRDAGPTSPPGSPAAAPGGPPSNPPASLLANGPSAVYRVPATQTSSIRMHQSTPAGPPREVDPLPSSAGGRPRPPAHPTPAADGSDN
ncbi:MAG: hypothetical protein U1A27_02995 [Phycisphaerae bacterium]